MQEPNQVLNQRTSPAPSYISASPGPSEPPPKRQRKKNEVDDALLALARNAQERRLMRERKEAEKRNPEPTMAWKLLRH